jgi:hypothetical protein
MLSHPDEEVKESIYVPVTVYKFPVGDVYMPQVVSEIVVRMVFTVMSYTIILSHPLLDERVS